MIIWPASAEVCTPVCSLFISAITVMHCYAVLVHFCNILLIADCLSIILNFRASSNFSRQIILLLSFLVLIYSVLNS